MQVTLKKLKYSEFASEETNCFLADVYVNGEPFAIAQNDGHGGSTHFTKHPKSKLADHSAFYAKLKEYDAICKANAPEEDKSYYNFDCLVDEVLTQELYKKDMKKLFSRSLIVVKKDESKGFYKFGKKKFALTDEGRINLFKLRLDKLWGEGSYFVLNSLPESEALNLYKACA